MSNTPLKSDSPVSAATTDLRDEAVAEYLQQNPRFFEDHRHLLETLRLPHGDNGNAVSLIERQVAVLRQKNEKIELKLRELMDVARSNDALADKIHKLSTCLLAAASQEEVVDILEEALRTSFTVDASVMVLWESVSGFADEPAGRFIHIIDRDHEAIGPFKTFLEQSKPRCGHIRDAQRDFLFGEDSIDIGSAALVPLGTDCQAGFLAIGSNSADYFHPGQSMDFLARLGELVGCALLAR